MTWREAVREVSRRLCEAGVENEGAESRFLLEAATQADRAFYLLHQEEEMPREAQDAYFALTKQRCRRIPLQYLTGEQEFMGLRFRVDGHVLIPRQDTEILVEETLRVIDRQEQRRKDRIPAGAGARAGACRLLDLCTGSGCIAVSIAALRPKVRVTAGDISPEALSVAERNGRENGTDITWVKSDLFACIDGRYDIIVSNPPYIPSGAIQELMPEVRDHEPVTALDGGEDGLAFYRRIVRESKKHLPGDGYLLLEIGADQGKAVTKLMQTHGFCEIEVKTDLAGLDRVVRGRRDGDV